MKQLLFTGPVQDFFKQFTEWSALQAFGITDVVEIIIISIVVYHIMKWVQLTRAWTLFKGILFLLVFALFSAIFHLDTISYILSRSLGVGIIAGIIIFQPELRRVLEQLGRRTFFSNLNFFGELDARSDVLTERTISEIVRACYEMGRTKTGALIVIEHQVALGEFERTGIPIDALVTSQLLINIFEKNTPLHDGAIIIRGNRVVSATCYLPLTESLEVGKALGTRHRAAIGISEVSDSVTIIVSEETGRVSMTKDGRLYYDLKSDELKLKLNKYLTENNSSGTMNVFSKWKGMLNNERSNNNKGSDK